MALWAPAFDQRIRVSLSNCGCIPYRHSLSRETGVQAEFVLPGFAKSHDIEDVIASFRRSSLSISAGRRDPWSRGTQEVYERSHVALGSRVELALCDVAHVFTPPMQTRAYRFLPERIPVPEVESAGHVP
jgi:hypothetical protein